LNHSKPCFKAKNSLKIYTNSTINNYAQAIDRFGLLFNLAELLLLIASISHIVYAAIAAVWNLQARSERYHHIKSAGKPSRQSIFSTTMKYTGGILLLFIIFHVATFKFGFSTTIPYIKSMAGNNIKDVYQLIISTFQQPLYVLIYVVAAIALSFHIQHGFFSAVQSLGISNPNYPKILGFFSTLFSLLIAIGFSSIPLCIYFGIVL
jgi:succinate dehydrogenase / fumarate reductase, cytochrome b subunit